MIFGIILAVIGVFQLGTYAGGIDRINECLNKELILIDGKIYVCKEKK